VGAEAGGSRLWLTVAISSYTRDTRSRPGLSLAMPCRGRIANRFVVVVDDDIDPAFMDKVFWAMCTRLNPREDMEVLRAAGARCSIPDGSMPRMTAAMRAS